MKITSGNTPRISSFVTKKITSKIPHEEWLALSTPLKWLYNFRIFQYAVCSINESWASHIVWRFS